jgi:hypothetical protein
LVTPQPLDHYCYSPSLAGSSVSTISTADSHLLPLLRLPRTRTAIQLYSGIGDKTRLCQCTPQSSQTDNGWGYFVDSTEVNSRKPLASTQQRRIFHHRWIRWWSRLRKYLFNIHSLQNEHKRASFIFLQNGPRWLFDIGMNPAESHLLAFERAFGRKMMSKRCLQRRQELSR